MLINRLYVILGMIDGVLLMIMAWEMIVFDFHVVMVSDSG